MSNTHQQSLDGTVVRDGPELQREWAMPNKWTFEIPPIQTFVENAIEQSDGVWIDPFSAATDYADITNDLSREYDTDYTLKARTFLDLFDDGEVDGGVLFDPPYSPRQVKESYNDVGMEPSQFETGSGWIGELRDEITRVCADTAVVCTFGWGSNGIGQTRGFEKTKILLVAHGGWHNDTIAVKEVYQP